MARPTSRPPKTPRNIKWTPDLWAQVLKASAVIAEREQIDLLPSEFVRRAVRKEVASVLAESMVAA